jgi:putative effector of murein hydrolase LrgA (UPF0299 family)
MVTNQTFQRQMHMYRLSSIQLFTNILFFFIPVGITIVTVTGLSKISFLGTINICIFVLNCPAQSLVAIIGYRRLRIKRTDCSSTAETTKNAKEVTVIVK